VLVVDINHNAALSMAAHLGAEAIDARAVIGGYRHGAGVEVVDEARIDAVRAAMN
jgi:hypothetical protein